MEWMENVHRMGVHADHTSAPRWRYARTCCCRRGLRDATLIEELRIGYAPGASLRQHLLARGYSLDLLRRTGLINPQGRDIFCRRVIFPCYQNRQVCNLYGRSIGAAFPHCLLPGSKGDLFAWESVRLCTTLILVEGLFDLAVLWQAGFRNSTCALGTHLTVAQFTQLCHPPRTAVYLAFDRDANQAGEQAALRLASQIKNAGVRVFLVELPASHDPNSYLVSGATAADLAACLERAHQL
jgi:DNA primase